MIARLAALTMRRARHQVLIFHRVVPAVDPMSPGEPTVDWFRRLAHMLASHFEVIGLDEALARRDAGRLDGRSLSITFDDGYADNVTQALPVLEAHGLPATFFVASGFLDGGRMWNDTIIETIRRLDDGVHDLGLPDTPAFTLSDWPSRRAAAEAVIMAWKHLPMAERQLHVDRLAERVSGLPDDLMMSTAQLRTLSASPCATIGGHTRMHPILAALDDAGAMDEIVTGKRELEDLLQREVGLFAYPNGKLGRDYLASHADMARQAGFRAAVSTDWGALAAASDPYHIPRFTPWHSSLGRFAIDVARCHHGLI